MTDQDMRDAVVTLLEEKGYKVSSTASGQGVPKLSRLKLEKDGTELACVVKVSSGGRISFTRAPDGTYRVLSDADWVIHAQPVLASPGHLRVMVFDRATVVRAFEENHKALVAHRMEHIPSWVNPEQEAGWRQSGSGFKDKALWTEVTTISGAAAASTPAPELGASAAPPPSGGGAAEVPGIMERIKLMLSEHLGVRPELIDVDVRVKI